MISKGNFEKEHIQEQIKQYPKVDPAKMEMTNSPSAYWTS